ncbi:unnamed protein product, partial [Mesorhabditis spiculigera]
MKKYKWLLFTYQFLSICFELYIHAILPEGNNESPLLLKVLQDVPNYGFLRTVPDLWVVDGSDPFSLWPVSAQLTAALSILFMALYYVIIGIAIPLFTLATPWAIGTTVIWVQFEIPAAAWNAIFFLDGCHALVASVEILGLTPCYRQYIFSPFRKLGRRILTIAVQQTPTNEKSLASTIRPSFRLADIMIAQI